MINSNTTLFGQANSCTQSANDVASKNYIQGQQPQLGQLSNANVISSLKSDVA
jgi:hypothetical protein